MPASATGTPTTNFGFATLNTSVDAPNGTGINNIIIDIDSKLDVVRDAQDAAIAAIAADAVDIGLVIALG
jgi:hypothetical protein